MNQNMGLAFAIAAEFFAPVDHGAYITTWDDSRQTLLVIVVGSNRNTVNSLKRLAQKARTFAAREARHKTPTQPVLLLPEKHAALVTDTQVEVWELSPL